jgi:hypothetical protein
LPFTTPLWFTLFAAAAWACSVLARVRFCAAWRQAAKRAPRGAAAGAQRGAALPAPPHGGVWCCGMGWRGALVDYLPHALSLLCKLEDGCPSFLTTARAVCLFSRCIWTFVAGSFVAYILCMNSLWRVTATFDHHGQRCLYAVLS